MKKKPTILLDMDGTIADFDGAVLAEIYRRFPTLPRITADQTTDWNIEASLPHWCGPVVQEIIHSKGFFLHLKPLPGAIDAIHEMEKEYDVWICSTPTQVGRYSHEEKYLWIETYLGKKYLHKTILTYDKTTVDGDILIDDKPIISGSVTPKWSHILYHHTFNSGYKQPRLEWNRDWKSIIASVVNQRKMTLSGETKMQRLCKKYIPSMHLPTLDASKVT